MAAPSLSDLSTVLEELHAGNQDAQSRLLHMVYDELRRMAACFMHGERPSHTWQPTDLVHEALVRLLGGQLPSRSRGEFFGAAAEAMRRLLVEHARRRKAQKRGDGRQRVPLDEVAMYFEQEKLDVAAVPEAVDLLSTFQPRQSQVVTWHYFGRFTVKEIAHMLAVSVSTVESDLRFARAWLHRQLAGTTS
jgi:RNA polymerase sigma factor (TIGR02999 family)